MKKILKTIFVCILLLGSVIPMMLFAATVPTFSYGVETNYIPLTDIPGFADATSAKNPGGILSTIFNLSIGIGSILAVIMIVIAGFKYMYEESIFGKGKAKEQITNAFFGLLLILGSYIILKTINGDLLRISLFLPEGDGAIGNLITKQKAFENELDAAIKSAEKVLVEAQNLRNQVKTVDEQIANLKTKIGTATGGFEAERQQLALAEQQKQTLVNKELYIRANEDPGLAITRAELEVLGKRAASGSTAETNVSATLTSAQRTTDNAIQQLQASDVNKTNPDTQKQIADLKAKKIVLDSSAEQLLNIEAYNKRVAAIKALGQTNVDPYGVVVQNQIPDSKYTNALDLYKAIIKTGNDEAQKLKDAGYTAEALKLQKDSVARANSVCQNNCSY